MGYVDYQNSIVSTAHSVTETERFGYLTDRISVGALGVQAAGSLAKLVKSVQFAIDKSDATIIILRYPAGLVSLLRDICVPGNTRIYPGGAILYWEAPRGSGTLEDTVDATSEIVPAERSAHAVKVIDVLEDSFKDYVNHYSANPLLRNGVVAEGYAEWARSSMSNPLNRVFTVEAADRTVGVAIVGVSRNIWEIELASIVYASQRKGYYLKLMQRVLASARAEGISKVVISTQSHNIAVQRAWAKLGFRPLQSFETVHIVRGDPSRQS